MRGRRPAIRVAPQEPGAADRLEAPLRKLGHLPFTRGYRLPPEGGVAYARQLFREGAEDPGGARSLVAEAEGEIVGGLVLRRLEWESKVFGTAMARIPFLFAVGTGREGADRPIAGALLEATGRVLRSWGIHHCSALVPAEETGLIHAFGERSWRLVDSTLEFAWECGRTVPPPDDPRVRLRAVREEDREPLSRLARESFSRTIRTRFSADPWLPIEKTGELYARWFDLACDGEFGDVVVVAEVDGRPVGFNTFKLDRGLSEATGVGFASHGIAAVDPARRGMGLQPAMLHWLAEWQRERGGLLSRGRVLISNYAMQRACLKSGGFVAQAYHSFHVWLED